MGELGFEGSSFDTGLRVVGIIVRKFFLHRGGNVERSASASVTFVSGFRRANKRSMRIWRFPIMCALERKGHAEEGM